MFRSQTFTFASSKFWTADGVAPLRTSLLVFEGGLLLVFEMSVWTVPYQYSGYWSHMILPTIYPVQYDLSWCSVCGCSKPRLQVVLL